MDELHDSAWLPFLLVGAAIAWFGLIALLLIGEWMLLGHLWKCAGRAIARIRNSTRQDVK